MKQTKTRGRAWVTVALLSTGAILATTGITMLVADLAKTKILYGAWKAVGIGLDGVSMLHQYSAIGFLGAATVHLTRNRKIIGRHLQQITPSSSSPEVAANPQTV
jgi:hypothetical protein